MTAHHTLITELEHAISHGTPQRRAEMLLQITDIFIRGSVRFSDDEIGLFDDLITRLAREIEVSVRSLLAERIAPIANAPVNLTRMLACDDEIRVAYPVLAQSERLDEATIVQNARSKSQAHLLAISRRKSLSEVVTDVLIQRGNRLVVLSTAKNRGAKFSEVGFSRLVKRSDGDDGLAACVGSRPDIPHRLFLALLAAASEVVRSKLVAERKYVSSRISHAVAMVTDRMGDHARANSMNFSAAQALIHSLNESAQLSDGTIRTFVEDGKFEETIVALACKCDVSVEVVERAMIQDQTETILVLAKAAGLSWMTTKELLLFRAQQQRISAGELEQHLASFERLSVGTARQIIEFYKMRRASGFTRPV